MFIGTFYVLRRWVERKMNLSEGVLNMAKEKTNYPEIDDIREDLESLKHNVVDLSKQIKNDGLAQTQELKKAALKQVDHLKDASGKQLKNVETHVKEKPAQSLAMAFAAGLVASFLFGRR